MSFEKLKDEFDKSQVAAEMPRYRCHKEVWALKIRGIVLQPRKVDVSGDELDAAEGGAMILPVEAGYAPFHVGADFLRRHNPKVGGYYVVYKDGYSSFSPADAFKEGYTAIS